MIPGYTSKGIPADEAKKKDASSRRPWRNAWKAAGYPAKADPAKWTKVMVIVILTYLVDPGDHGVRPIAAMLVEMFPTRIRYTSMSCRTTSATAGFGGLLPTTSFAIVAQTGNMYNGLWYPIIIAGITVVIGTLFPRETRTWTSTPRTTEAFSVSGECVFDKSAVANLREMALPSGTVGPDRQPNACSFRQ